MIRMEFDKENNRTLAYDNEKKIGECVFVEDDKFWNIVHTEVNNSYQGQGIAKKLVENVIKEASRYNKNVIAECSYAKRVIEKI